ncbi:MAG: hypothetical protein KDD83_00005 [Caldilineaceae bacterium]|nr:hypothetical protein [Caldilineaceae bacterium]
MTARSQGIQPAQADRPSAPRTGTPHRIFGRSIPNPRLLIALLGVLVFHGGLSLFGTYRNTYDAYVHIFFADHWRRTWFDHWDTRWYTGFTLTSYPPLSQQSVAAVAMLTGDLELAFVIVQTAALAVMTVGMYRFARIWVSEEAAGWAALWLVFSTAMAETVHVFGQLPTVFSLGLLLNALPFAYRWVGKGRLSDLLKAWALTAATTGGHHVTTLFGAVFITAPVIVLALVESFRTPLADEPPDQPRYITRANWRALVVRRARRISGPVVRSGIFAVGTVALLIIVVLPYWLWSRSDPITQVPIPHASRDNFLVNLNAGLVFWLIPYGMLIFLFPYVYIRGAFSRLWPLLASIALLMLLGTGGTTPIPKLLLGGAFDILTLDRFTLWASILMLPIAGDFVVSLLHGGVARWLRVQFGDLTWRGVQLFFLLGLLLAAVLTVNLTQFRKFQPAPIDMQPIVNFMQKDQHERWRYLTLGFGDQMAWLSAQMTAAQVDGNYHSARRLPELTTTPVERLEGAKFRGIPGIGSLQQFLAVPEKYNLKYVFANDRFYDPLLFFYGWHRVQTLENGIVVWERADIPVLPEALPRREIPVYQRVMWGTLPPLALLAALLATTATFWSTPFRFLAEVSGANTWTARLPRTRINPLRSLGQALDRRLLAASRMPAQESRHAPPWQVWVRWTWRKSQRRLRPDNLRARQIRAVLLALVMLSVVAAGTVALRNRRSDPIRQVEGYYDDIDFRRMGDAYARLNPATRPTYEQFLLEQSVQGGLVASYSKLDTLATQIVTAEPDYLEVDATATYITALDYYTDTARLTLTRSDAHGWTIEPQPVDVSVPPEQFARRARVDYLSQGRARVTDDTTSFADILARPELAILSTRLLLRADGRFSLVGELMNTDVDPADVTVTAYLYDTAGNELTWYNAGDGMMHKLPPLDITPFRVDFEGVAGMALEETAEALSFRPGASWGYVLPDDAALGAYNVFGKAVVTGRDLARDLAVQDLSATIDGGRLTLAGTLANIGLDEALIPHVFVTLYDEAGAVAWVEHVYLPDAVRPQRRQDFTIPVTPDTELDTVDIPGSAFTNALTDPPVTPGPRPDFIPLPPASGYAYARVSAHAYDGGQE